jgi:hypothetical protein
MITFFIFCNAYSKQRSAEHKLFCKCYWEKGSQCHFRTAIVILTDQKKNLSLSDFCHSFPWNQLESSNWSRETRFSLPAWKTLWPTVRKGMLRRHWDFLQVPLPVWQPSFSLQFILRYSWDKHIIPILRLLSRQVELHIASLNVHQKWLTLVC